MSAGAQTKRVAEGTKTCLLLHLGRDACAEKTEFINMLCHMHSSRAPRRIFKQPAADESKSRHDDAIVMRKVCFPRQTLHFVDANISWTFMRDAFCGRNQANFFRGLLCGPPETGLYDTRLDALRSNDTTIHLPSHILIFVDARDLIDNILPGIWTEQIVYNDKAVENLLTLYTLACNCDQAQFQSATYVVLTGLAAFSNSVVRRTLDHLQAQLCVRDRIIPIEQIRAWWWQKDDSKDDANKHTLATWVAIQEFARNAGIVSRRNANKASVL